MFEAHDILEHSPSALVVLDSECRFLYLNKRALRYTGTAESVLGRSLFDTLPELVGTPAEAAIRTSLRGRTEVRLDRFTNPASRRVFTVLVAPIGDGVAIHFRDITYAVRRQRQQAAVAEFGLRALFEGDDSSATLLQEGMDNIRAGLDADFTAFHEIDTDGTRISLIAGSGWDEGTVGSHTDDAAGARHVALAAQRSDPVAFGPGNEGEGTPFRMDTLLAAHGVVSGIATSVLSGEGVHGVVAAYSRADRLFTSDDLHFLQGMANAIAGLQMRWRASAELARGEIRLRQAQKMEAVGRLAGGVAHDFNNLLTLIHSYSEMAIADLAEHPSVRADVEEIRKAAQKAASLTRQLLAFSRRQVMRPRELNLNDVIEGLEKMLVRVIGEDVQMQLDLAPDLTPVLADPGQIEQVLMNLVLNSRDAMPRGGIVTISSRNRSVDTSEADSIEDATAGDYVELTVTDTGDGIPADVLPHIFEPFFSTREPWRGGGLGLSTVYGIVTQSGGFVTAESGGGSGAGAALHVFLPVHRAEALSEVPAPSNAEPTPRTSQTVLLVEDEQSVRMVARRVLEREGLRVIEAISGDEAWALFGNTATPLVVDLILTDIVMPGMNGRTFVRKLRESGNRTRVLFMSGYSEDDVVQPNMLPSDATFLEKPFSPQQLMLAVRAALGGG